MNVPDEDDVLAKTRRLAPRQVECLRLVYDRRTSKEIASAIGLSATTVDSYITESIALLGARNRRHAAELLHEAAPPEQFRSRSSGDEKAHSSLQPASRRPFRWSDWLPFRQPGVSGNDLNPAARLLLTVIVAAGLAIGFGMLAVGARVVSDLFAVWH